MKKVLFDASVHLGQFDIQDEARRIWCKNSQISISEKDIGGEIEAYYTFNENGWMDAIIWNLDRETQDTFYPFMDVFYSVKDIKGLPFNSKCMDTFNELKLKFPNVDDSNLLSSSVAIINKVDEIHSSYDSFNNQDLIMYLKNLGVLVCTPNKNFVEEKDFSRDSGLENLYQRAYSRFKKVGVNPSKDLHL